MKKSTIWLVAVVMGLSFIGLLYLQISYIEEMTKMKREQFDESVNRALDQVSRNLEIDQTARYLEKDVNAIKDEMTKDRKLLQKSLNQHETLIDRITSYQEGVYMSRRVYNWYLGIFACSVIIVTALITMGIFVWMKNN